MIEIESEVLNTLLGNNKKDINKFMKDNRDELVTYLKNYKLSPKSYDRTKISKLLVILEKLQGGGIFIPRVHEYNPVKELNESELIRIMTEDEFVDYAICFFGPNYETNKESNLIHSLSRELFKEIALFDNE